MSNASQELLQAIFKGLLSDVQLLTELGGPSVCDRVPERIKPPYIVMGRIGNSDWSTATEDGCSHSITLHVWTTPQSRVQNFTLQDHVERILTTQLQPLSDEHLVNMRRQFSETRLDRNAGLMHGLMRFVAKTEPDSQTV